MRETGLEPASSYEHMNLNHARLPIPPFPHGTGDIIQRAGGFVKGSSSLFLFSSTFGEYLLISIECVAQFDPQAALGVFYADAFQRVFIQFHHRPIAAGHDQGALCPSGFQREEHRVGVARAQQTIAGIIQLGDHHGREVVAGAFKGQIGGEKCLVGCTKGRQRHKCRTNPYLFLDSQVILPPINNPSSLFFFLPVQEYFLKHFLCNYIAQVLPNTLSSHPYQTHTRNSPCRI